MASTKSILSTAASLAASAMLIRSIANDFLPHHLHNYVFFRFHNLLSRFSTQMTITIEEIDGFSINQMYVAAEIYLGSKSCSSTCRRIRVSKPEKDKNISVSVDKDEEIIDTFEEIELKWTFACRETESRIIRDEFNSTVRSEVQFFLLTFHKKYKDRVLGSYLPHVLHQSKALKEEKKGLKLYTVKYERIYGNFNDAWNSINLDHPATFQTIAMDPEQKCEIMADLDRFVKRREYYRKVGKAWKRGYLLYGPPGTGKSSLIAAIANYLNFNIYDLELSDIQCNSELRKLLVATANRSILVVEDIDCSIDLNDRQENQVTLSGLLNFIDGLWSSCGDERIIIFTTNHKEKLDPALLRPGRMDMHIHMSYCSPKGFKLLANNYLGIQDHHLFRKIEALFREVEVTPAQIAEELMKHDNPEMSLAGVVEFLTVKKMEVKQVKDGEEDKTADGEEARNKGQLVV
ncbi:protein HYPER-SENSITIVITY-RELATED 4-like isoform X2 [Aristolochia californica]|uniref:protein HYPER-SENSITIVITY-RELATED 4-like isoform X2 n=1 Tax=Aristolochia californica TaxID=171875 RepID=UPI0035E11E3F